MKNTRSLRIFTLFLILFLGIFPFISAGQGGAAVPVISISLTEQGNDYNMKPGRLKFEFDEKLYAIQMRRIKQEYVDFLIMTLDMDKQEDITAYTLDNSFSLNPDEKKEIDLDKNEISDILIELKGIKPNPGFIKSADFSLKKINTKKPEDNNKNITINTETINSEITGNLIQEPISEPVIAFDKDSKEQPTFLDKIINFFKIVVGIE